MAIDIKGLDRILRNLDYLDVDTKKSTKKAIDKALEDTLPILKENSPEDSGQSRNHLSIEGKGAKTYRKSTWGKMGITSENWEQTKSLWFNHHSFYNHGLNFNGQFKIDKNVGFFDRAGDKVIPKAKNIILDELNKEIKKHL